MKVLIVVGTSLRYCPYANFYIDLLQDSNIDFDVVFPDKAKLNDHYNFSTKVYNWNLNNNKYIELVNYRKYVLNLLKSESYNCVILLTTVLAVMFYSALKKKAIKYIVDIRDYTHEDLKPFYWAESRAIRYSTCCVISSPGFRNFLPEFDYIDVFNAATELKSINCLFEKNDGSRPIKISYVGTIAYPEQCERLIKLVELDDRFEFDLYGNDLNGDRISRYIIDNKLKRSVYHGPYKPEEKGDIIRHSDILFNAYGNDSPLLLYALSNKLTDAAVYLKPVLNSPGTSMHEALDVMSYAIDFQKDNTLENLYDWYVNLKANDVYRITSELLDRINQTNYLARKHLLLEISGQLTEQI